MNSFKKKKSTINCKKIIESSGVILFEPLNSEACLLISPGYSHDRLLVKYFNPDLPGLAAYLAVFNILLQNAGGVIDKNMVWLPAIGANYSRSVLHSTLRYFVEYS